ncbi:TolC family protein [bacterium]|nr:MAG: TolC family protein [bacterium]
MHNQPDKHSQQAHFLRIKVVFALLFFLSINASVFTQNTFSQAQSSSQQKIDLEQAITIALANNTQIKRSLLALKTADEQIRIAWGSVMPTISANMNYTRNLEIPVTFIPARIFDPTADPDLLMPAEFGTDNSWNGGFAVSQTLFSGQAFVGISSSELYKAAQTEGMRATAQGIVTQTRIAYYQALVSKEKYRLVEAQYNRLKINLDDTREYAKQGFTDDYSVLSLEVQLANVEPQLTKATYEVEKAKQELLSVLGLPVNLPISIEGNLAEFNILSSSSESPQNSSIKKIDQLTPVNLNDEQEYLKDALSLRGDLRVLGIQKNLQGKQLTAEISSFLPTLNANYNLFWASSQAGAPDFFGDETNRARSQTLGIGLQVPIFSGFKRLAAVQIAKIQIKDTELQINQAQQDAHKEIYSARLNLKEAIQTNEALKKAVQQAKTGFERAQVRYKNGVGSQKDVTDAELQLHQAEINYAQMVSGYLMSKALYDQAVGQVPFVAQDIQTIKEKIVLN